MKLSTDYFHMKTKILADFQICISVPLRKLFLRFKELKHKIKLTSFSFHFLKGQIKTIYKRKTSNYLICVFCYLLAFTTLKMKPVEENIVISLMNVHMEILLKCQILVHRESDAFSLQ